MQPVKINLRIRIKLSLPETIPGTHQLGNNHRIQTSKVVNKIESALLFMICHEQITKMCFLLRCQFFPLPVTDGSQCYYRNRLIFLMSHFNRLQNLTVAAHPCQTICTNRTFTETTKKLCCQTAIYSIKFHIVEQKIQINNHRRRKCICKRDRGNRCKTILQRPIFS